ncbi:MAG: heme lyase CcmF/NrfE family subunit [Gammaproteobacteria bacterium]|nr:heme lyase CcmF/NrfE family subunit [Gammaproteobacteria bacterium]
MMGALVLPELGHFSLILAFIFSIYQMGVGGVAARCGLSAHKQLAYLLLTSVYGQVFFLILSYLALTYAFLTHDFSVSYVAAHAHTRLPWPYRLSAVWSAHEGSLLLWVTLLGGWSAAFLCYARTRIPLAIQGSIVMVLGVLSVGFISFLLFTSNPFLRLLPEPPLEGQGLNPLLQDPGLAIHPPMLYMGYVGFALAFAVAVAALLRGKFDGVWVQWLKPWVMLAWSFLTLGITLGSWWAYRVLGWGGWWFWDPVENAALLPWLAATALFHSLIMVEKRHAFKIWVLLLAILTFCLSLLGTFLVRSGVLISVHAFASDPLRGAYLLKFLMTVVCLALLLFAWRSPLLVTRQVFHFLSKETFLLINNIILFVLMISVLFATLYPLFLDVLGMGKISVGPPYFNAVFIPLFLLLVIAMCIGPCCHWQKTRPGQLIKQLRWPICLAVMVTVVIKLGLPPLPWLKIIALFLSLTLAFTTVFISTQRRRLGMMLAHMGVAVCALGIILSTSLQTQRELSMRPGDSIAVGGHQFEFMNVHAVEGENYEGVAADFRVYHGLQTLGLLSPEKRHYFSSQNGISQAAISSNLFRDLYIVLGEPLEKNNWAVRIYNKPYVRFIWLGGLLMMLGGLISLSSKK